MTQEQFDACLANLAVPPNTLRDDPKWRGPLPAEQESAILILAKGVLQAVGPVGGPTALLAATKARCQFLKGDSAIPPGYAAAAYHTVLCAVISTPFEGTPPCAKSPAGALTTRTICST